MVGSNARKMDKSTVLKSTILFLKNHNGTYCSNNGNLLFGIRFKSVKPIYRNSCTIKSARNTGRLETVIFIERRIHASHIRGMTITIE